MVEAELPEQGVVFWPVGTGDSTTIVLGDGLVMQIDLRDMKAADEDDAVVAAVIDRLAETLPKQPDGEAPYLALFALTHADKDHCCGFGDLLDSPIHIGEIWATPRLWRERDEDTPMCEDAQLFHDEVERRVKATIEAVKAGKEPDSGDKVRIIGYDDDRDQHSYAALPDAYFTTPGDPISTIDGNDVSGRFEAFVHAPFRGDCAGERNDTSLALQVKLTSEDGTEGRILLLGDLAYPTIKKILDYSESHDRTERVEWDILLSPHHCSKKVMYAPGEDGAEELKQDILDQLKAHARPDARVIASSLPFRPSDKSGDNPPHLLARAAYETISELPVLCTGEHPSEDDPRPVVFVLEPGLGLDLVATGELEEKSVALAGRSGTLLTALGLTHSVPLEAAPDVPQQRGIEAGREAVRQARGDEAVPATSVGFGDV
ncbi:hypothetical protein OHB25_59415 [Streptomyces mirabilis]|uniref:hypothetical protein n=1 Tax=Streptomyces mirabilis TaxID=68239 RepID=UPI002E221400